MWTQVVASWTCVQTCVGWPNGLASARKLSKKPFKCYCARYNSVFEVKAAKLALTCVGWPNGKKLAFTCVQIWSRPKWTQVIASARKSWPNGDASKRKLKTCVPLHLRLARALNRSLEHCTNICEIKKLYSFRTLFVLYCIHHNIFLLSVQYLKWHQHFMRKIFVFHWAARIVVFVVTWAGRVCRLILLRKKYVEIFTVKENM